jgi:hypothetical protein
MTAFTIFLTFLLLLLILAVGSWAALLVHQRLEFLGAEQNRINLAAIEDSRRFEKLVDELTTRQEATERRAAEADQRPVLSVNYTQRSQMLRMVRRGDSAEQIAANLGVPLSQIRLLMKLPAASSGAVGGRGQPVGQ